MQTHTFLGNAGQRLEVQHQHVELLERTHTRRLRGDDTIDLDWLADTDTDSN